MYIFTILGILNCFTYTLTQGVFVKYLIDIGCEYYYIVPILTTSYFLRFLWDKPISLILNKLLPHSHKSMVLILSILLFLTSVIYLTTDVPWYVYTLLFSFLGASQTNVIESYKTEFNGSNKQTSSYLLGYRGAKIAISSLVLYIVSVLQHKTDIILAYKLAFCVIGFLILLLGVFFSIKGKRTSKYTSHLSIADISKLKEVILKIKEVQTVIIFTNICLFRSADTMLSYVYLIFLGYFMATEDLALINFVSCSFSLIGIFIAYRIKERFSVKLLLPIAGVLQSISFLLFIFLDQNIHTLMIAATLFKIIGCFSTDLIATLMRSNAGYTKGFEASAYILAESGYRFSSFIAGTMGSFLFIVFSPNVFFLICTAVSLTSTAVFQINQNKIKELV